MAGLKNKLVVAAGVTFVALGLYLAYGRQPARTDEQLLQDLVADVASAASRRDVSAILDHVSPQFRGRSGAIATRDDLRGLLLGVLLRAGWAQVMVLDRHFDLQGDTANGTVRFVGVRTGPAPTTLEALRPGMDAYEVEARFRREEGAWRV